MPMEDGHDRRGLRREGHDVTWYARHDLERGPRLVTDAPVGADTWDRQPQPRRDPQRFHFSELARHRLDASIDLDKGIAADRSIGHRERLDHRWVQEAEPGPDFGRDVIHDLTPHA